MTLFFSATVQKENCTLLCIFNTLAFQRYKIYFQEALLQKSNNLLNTNFLYITPKTPQLPHTDLLFDYQCITYNRYCKLMLLFEANSDLHSHISLNKPQLQTRRTTNLQF